MALNSSFSLSRIYHCSEATVGFYTIAAFAVTKIFLLLPLSLLVLYLGLQQWKQQRSFATTSHVDIFSYNTAFMELTFVLGGAFYFCGKCVHWSKLMAVGYYLCCVFMPGETSFHLLTCVERYLAAVHPVIYLGLKQSGGVRIRNISIGCVWLLCFGWMGVLALYSPEFPSTLITCGLFLVLVVVVFCNLSVLHVLLRPGPGEMVRNREQVNQSKQRAFNTIAAILGVLCFCVLGCLVCLALDNSHVLSYTHGCLVLLSGNLFTLPTSLVSPLLFLQRAGKLNCCQCKNNDCHR